MEKKYESRSLEFRKHLMNLIHYARSDRTTHPLDESVAFLQGYMDGLVQHEIDDYDSWLKDQKENADLTPHHENVYIGNLHVGATSKNVEFDSLNGFLKNEPTIKD